MFCLVTSDFCVQDLSSPSSNMNSASQRDMFGDDQVEDNVARPMSSLDPSKKVKEILYKWIILFIWDVDVESPFSMYDIKEFTEKDIKPEWIKKNLLVPSRIKKLTNLSPFPGGTYSLFAKVEAGAPLKQRLEIVSALNKKFKELSRMPESDIGICVREVADNSPYRYLSTNTKIILCAENNLNKSTEKTSSIAEEEEHDSEPLSPSLLDRSASKKETPETTAGKKSSTSSGTLLDGSELWDEDLSEYPDHVKFIQKLRSGQEKANATGKRSQICWRGHRTSLGPKNGQLEKSFLLKKLIQALKTIRTVKEEEKQVTLTFIPALKTMYDLLLFFTYFSVP